MKTSFLALGALAAVVCCAREVLIPVLAGASAADYLETVRAAAASARVADPDAVVGGGGAYATDELAKAFIGFGESEEIDFWQVAEPTLARVNLLRGLFDAAGGKAVRLVDGTGKALDPAAQTASARLTGTLPTPLLVAGTGRAYILEPNGTISWQRTGCGNIHRVQRHGDWIYYSNGDLLRCKLPGTKAELVYHPKTCVGAGVLGFEVLPNGNVVLAVNSMDEVVELAAGTGRELVKFKVDPKNAKGETPGVHGHLRMIRKTAKGTYLVCCAGASCVREYDAGGKLVWEQSVPVMAFDCWRRANGNTLISHITGVTEYTPNHQAVWTFKAEDLPELKLGCLCGVQELANGNLVIGTWANGEPDASKATAFEITRGKKLVWAWYPNTDRNMMTAVRLGARDALDAIDPLIGTEGTGSQYGGMMPMTGVPFGSVQWVPMTRLTEVGTLSYNEIDKQLLGFIAARQPAIWMGEWGQVSFLPRTGVVDCDFVTRGAPLDHAQEKATPWKYTVETPTMAAEMAGTSRAAIWRIAFRGANPHVVIDASRDYRKGPSDIRPADGALEIGADGRMVSGWNSDRLDAHHSYPLPNFRGWFVMEFSRPFTACGTYVGDPKSVKNPQKALGNPQPTDYQKITLKPGERTVQADRCGGWVEFAESDEPLFVKVGVSLISREQAWENLKREIPAWDLEAVAAQSKAAWAEKFARLQIETPDESVRTIFYTGLYHALLYPREIGEYGRYYSAFDDKVHSGDSYSCYSLWDTYRAEHPLLTLVAPERVDGMMQALLQNYREGGWLPKWPNPGYTGIMVGAPAEMVLAEAWSKGFRGFDVRLAYEAVKKNATVPQPTDRQFDWRDRGCFDDTPETRAGLSWYQELGYIACDKVTESVSRTQDFCLNDTAAAILADAVGKSDDAAFFRTRSKCYTNLWNAAAKRFLPRWADGAWENPRKGHHYCECSPETGLWCIPHDVEGLVALLGGPATFEKELDTYFETLFWKPERGNKSIHGNEPSHHTSYLYNFCGKPEKTAFRVREIMSRSYSTNRKGVDGNEDCGQMSAWYILSALGFYPMNPATGWYEIGSPRVDRATLHFGAPYRPATLEIVCRNQAPENYRVLSVTFNGQPLKNHRIHHNELVKGGRLEFVMGR